MAAVYHGDLLFLTDTEGKYPNVYVPEHTRKLGPGELGKVLNAETIPKEISLINPWPAGPIVRRSSVYSDNLTATPAQLTDSIYMCVGVRATVPPGDDSVASRRHYLGFTRGRVAEDLHSTARGEFSLGEFVIWTKGFSKSIASTGRALPDFFRRYLSPVPPPSPVIGEYLVLNLFEGDVELEDDKGNPLVLDDAIITLSELPSVDGNPRFQCLIRYHRMDQAESEEHTVVKLVYERELTRFRIHSEPWNSQMLIGGRESGEREGIVTYLNNNDESFTVALQQPDIFYNAQSFYKIDYSHAETRISNLLTTLATLKNASSEKGEVRDGQKSWDKSSLFSIIDSRARGGIVAEYFGKSDFMFCDDLNKEVADFVCVNFAEKKIALIHAKHGSSHKVSASALHVVVAQGLKNLGVLCRAGSKPAELNRWTRESRWSTSGIPRWRRGRATLPEGEQLWEKVRSEVLDHPDGQKEIWLVLGDTLSKRSLVNKLSNPSRWDPVSGQVVHLLSSLQASCSQLSVKLRVFCD
jgi:hypothetical protein